MRNFISNVFMIGAGCFATVGILSGVAVAAVPLTAALIFIICGLLIQK